MDSKLAIGAKDALLTTAQRLTPEERLHAFLAHSRLMAELHAAGAPLRKAVTQFDDATGASPSSKLP
jgi:hypothetical protein